MKELEITVFTEEATYCELLHQVKCLVQCGTSTRPEITTVLWIIGNDHELIIVQKALRLWSAQTFAVLYYIHEA